MLKLVLDANILFSIMNPNSTASFLFSSLRVEFFSTEYLKYELHKYKLDCLRKSELSEHEFEIRWDEIMNEIEFCKFSEYEAFLEESIESVSDTKDAPYVALALAINAAIWSNDRGLKKQSLAKVFTTNELVDELLKSKL